MPTHHITVQGKVQGVFYRASARKKALEIGITGWVKNTAEHHVEIIACGNDAQLNEFETWCHKGPANAVVEEVIVEKTDDSVFDEFKILR